MSSPSSQPFRGKRSKLPLIGIIVCVAIAIAAVGVARILPVVFHETHSGRVGGRDLPQYGGIVVITNCNGYLKNTAVSLAQEVCELNYLLVVRRYVE